MYHKIYKMTFDDTKSDMKYIEYIWIKNATVLLHRGSISLCEAVQEF